MTNTFKTRSEYLRTGFFLLLLPTVIWMQGCTETPTPTPVKTGYYADGEARVALEAQSTQQAPVNLIVLGDGFIEEDYKDEGAFDQAADRAITALFSLEPYKTYKQYFRVQKVAAYSIQRGATTSTYSTVNTVFNVKKLTSGTGLSGSDDVVFSYAKKAEGVSSNNINQCAILVISNYTAYAGTTYSYLSGRSIAYVTLSAGTSQQTRFENVVIHEFGGHGFGRLADEYVTNPQLNINENTERVDEIKKFQATGANQNISLSSEKEEAPWNYFFNYATLYPNVSMYEGAALYGLGVWRPESISCMDDNRTYFNGPSRAAIVKRILEIAGGSFDMDDFIDNDVDRLSTLPAGSATKAAVDPDFIPLAPPVLILE